MDIPTCIIKLGLAGNNFRLNQSNPPHKITQWNGPDPQPTQEQLETAWAEWQAEYDALQYQRDRKAKYPSIEECVHAILDDDLDALQAKRAEVKARYPKP